MTFRDQIAADTDSAFFNMDEFAETKQVDGKPMRIMIDDFVLAELGENRSEEMYQTYTKSTVAYIPKEDYGARPKLGKSIRIDNRIYTITNVVESMGVYELTIESKGV